MGVSDNTVGLALAVASSAFIGASFILKKIGLIRAGKGGVRAGGGGYTYLLEPLWWAGMITMLFGEIANFVAYAFAPAVLVTPLGALSIIVSSLLAHFVLKERLEKLGVLGCVSCIVGSVIVVIHAPQEHMPNSVEEIWNLAIQPGFLTYAAATLLIVAALVLFFEPRYGQTNIMIYLGICSSMGSLTVVSIKAIGVAIKLTLDGMNQVAYPHTWLFVIIAIICVVSQINYLNKALDTFDLAVVSPIYYVMFTTLTIVASGIMFKDWAGQSFSGIASEFCGLITILTGTIMLHTSKEEDTGSSAALPWPLDRGSISWYISLGSDSLLKNVNEDYFAALQRDFLYNALSPKVAPDVVFGPDDEGFQPLVDYEETGSGEKSCLSNWDCRDTGALLSLIKELRELYIEYQKKRAAEVDDARLKFEISTVLSKEGIEVCMVSSNGRPDEVKFAVPLLDLDLAKLVPECPWKLPQKIHLQAVFPISRSYSSVPSAPRLKLVSTPDLKSFFSVDDVKLPPWLDGMCMAEYLPNLEENLKIQVVEASASIGSRRRFIEALAPTFGRPLEADPLSINQYE
ncbi:hypothetical protein E2562_014380 [Oryza meyeriana var. granulata]|uniref:Probable magnesium transporter n=1 Tax=Oryza meyeriana var. granulata TaxID=110450 RepID=A0A6G1CPN0_9ORYZ|nr:hypothetical protein E2562_014380 [Oryza meyeriana var. granulata]